MTDVECTYSSLVFRKRHCIGEADGIHPGRSPELMSDNPVNGMMIRPGLEH
jgi:hypothetical protein